MRTFHFLGILWRQRDFIFKMKVLLPPLSLKHLGHRSHRAHVFPSISLPVCLPPCLSSCLLIGPQPRLKIRAAVSQAACQTLYGHKTEGAGFSLARSKKAHSGPSSGQGGRAWGKVAVTVGSLLVPQPRLSFILPRASYPVSCLRYAQRHSCP